MSGWRFLSTTFGALALVAVLLAASAPAGATESTSAQRWAIVDIEDGCPDDLADRPPTSELPTLTRSQALCLPPGDAQLTPSAQLTQVDGSTDRIAVAGDWSFTVEELAAGFVVAEAKRRGGVPLTVVVLPEIDIGVEWHEPTGAEPTAAEAVRADGEVNEDDLEDASPTESKEADGAIDAEVLGIEGATKTISIGGRDARGLDDAAIAGRFEVRDDIPATLTVIDSPPGSTHGASVLALPLVGRTVSYGLAPVDVGAGEVATETQNTELWLDGSVLVARTSTELVVEGSELELTVEQTNFDGAVSRTSITLSVRNTGDEPLAGPVTVILTAQDTPVFGGFENQSEGGQSGEPLAMTWEYPTGLGAGQTMVESVDAILRPGDANVTVLWTAEVVQSNDDADGSVVLARSEASTAVPASDDTDSGKGEVNFTPGQLIRLIAFVIAFALMAIIFGAWSRNRRIDSSLLGNEAAAHREHERFIFKSFAEAIIVLVIIVSILVLALEGSLQAESAASLIGVIAGYALGQRR